MLAAALVDVDERAGLLGGDEDEEDSHGNTRGQSHSLPGVDLPEAHHLGLLQVEADALPQVAGLLGIPAHGCAGGLRHPACDLGVVHGVGLQQDHAAVTVGEFEVVVPVLPTRLQILRVDGVPGMAGQLPQHQGQDQAGMAQADQRRVQSSAHAFLPGSANAKPNRSELDC